MVNNTQLKLIILTDKYDNMNQCLLAFKSWNFWSDPQKITTSIKASTWDLNSYKSNSIGLMFYRTFQN